MEFLKLIYEFVGTPYPRLSLVGVAILGAAITSAIWLFTAAQVNKNHKNSNVPSQVSGPASSTGNQSPANTGNGNEFNYDQSSNSDKKTKVLK